MKTQVMKAAVAALFGGAILIAAGVASAAPSCTAIAPDKRVPAKVCMDNLAAVYVAIDEAVFTGKYADESKTCLLAKNDNAVAKTNIAKYLNAIQKLEDIQANVRKLGADKLDPAARDDIDQTAAHAIECLKPYAQ